MARERMERERQELMGAAAEVARCIESAAKVHARFAELLCEAVGAGAGEPEGRVYGRGFPDA